MERTEQKVLVIHSKKVVKKLIVGTIVFTIVALAFSLFCCEVGEIIGYQIDPPMNITKTEMESYETIAKYVWFNGVEEAYQYAEEKNMDITISIPEKSRQIKIEPKQRAKFYFTFDLSYYTSESDRINENVYLKMTFGARLGLIIGILIGFIISIIVGCKLLKIFIAKNQIEF